LHLSGFTLDDTYSLDLDDAIWASEDDAGDVHLTVCIADVAGSIPRGSDLDKAARDRVTTRYWIGGNNPMIPRTLSEGSLSLLPKVSRQVLGIQITLSGQTGEVQGLPTLSLGVLQSKEKLAYSLIPGILVDESHPRYRVLDLLQRVALHCLDERRSQGALVFYDLNKGWVTSEEGHLLKLERAQANVGYIIVQEMMILANQGLAQYTAHHNIPVLYRNHTAKAAAPAREEIQRQIDLLQVDPTQVDVVRQRIHTVMNRATYDAVILGHYGLSLPCYLHGTSPIRRYADLVTQRQLRAHLLGEPLPYSQEEIAAEGTYLVTRLRELEDRASAAAKDRANRLAESRKDVMSPEHLAALKPVDFERVLKVSVRSEINTEVVEAIWRRARAGTLTPLEVFIALCLSEASWLPMKKGLLEFLLRNAHMGPSICSIGMNVLGWSDVSIRSQQEGDLHAPRFRVVATLTREAEPFTSPEVVSPSIRGAKARATVLLLARLAGVQVDTPPPPDQQIPPPPKNPVQLVDRPDNPIAALQDHAQQNRLPVPEYTFQRAGGPEHAPLFTCTCTYLGLVLISPVDGNKKAAKKAVAGQVVRGILGAERPVP